LKGKNFKELVEIMERLRSRKGCPWDREQTFETIKTFLLEESYEVLEAINKKNYPELCEELGDLLFQILFISKIAEESHLFDINDVINSISEKMKRRHPHVFGKENADTPEQVLKRWEQIKKDEKLRTTEDSILSGIPPSLPPFKKALRISEKVCRVGFDWDQLADLMQKFEEEVSEFLQCAEQDDRERWEEELGDLLFTLVNVGRKLKIDPEWSLEKSNQKFAKRFKFVESELRKKGKKPEEVSLDVMEDLWKQSKKYD
jgi:tetrapyrrole methylase family protein/MazG family protein